MDTPHDPLAALRPAVDSRDPRASALLRAFTPGQSLDGRPVLLGLPYDGGIPSRPGARFGPKALREALAAYGAFNGFSQGFSQDARELGEVLDLGDLSLAPMNGARAHGRIQEAARALFATGARPFFMGGDHGLTGSLLKGLAEARPGLRLALLTLDAHLDVREYDDEASLSSGTPFRRALETSVLTGPRTAMLGLRPFANSRYYLSWARAQGIHLYSVDDLAERGAVTVVREALSRILADADALYLSVDIDAADAAVAPGVSAVGVGGLSAREMIDVVRTVAAEPRLVGADLMELSPPHDENARTAKLAARLFLEVLSGWDARARP